MKVPKISSTRSTLFKPVLLSLLGLAILFYGGFCTLLYFQQNAMIFYPRPVKQNALKQAHIAFPTLEDLSFKTPDDCTLKGWMVRDTTSSKAPLVIFFGGNADEVSHWIWNSPAFSGYSLALVNYRGYGDSQGTPSQDALFQDALQIYDSLAQREDVDPKKIILMGSSLGTGVAIHTASKRPVDALILATPYDSLAEVAQEKYPVLPVKRLLKHPFNSIDYAPSIDAPILMLVAEEDKTIPPNHAKHLADHLGGSINYQVISGADHNTISQNPLYWDHIKAFLQDRIHH